MSVDARPTQRRGVGRALLALALLCAGGAVWLGLEARDRPDPDQVTLDVETAVATTPPSTIAPRTPTEPVMTTDDASPVTSSTAVPPPTTVPLSPLAELLGPAGSAIPPVVEPRSRPTALVIPSIDVLRPVRAVGLEDDGELEVPDETEIGWYRYGATPGDPGATVLAAHVTWNRTLGPFFRLGEMEPGERVDVVLDDGSTRVYEVIERTIYDKDELPRDRIWRNSGPESLVLITCGGSYNPDIRRYRQNIVVYAVPVDQIEAAAT
ncbi:MAG: sortase [Ilumatobacter sp.]|nr:sortase [Ilumatobacter sp.]